MSHVFVLDTDRQPLMPCSPVRARILLRRGRAAVFRRFPFTVILTRRISDPQTQALQNPEIAGVEYQQGTLAGYEQREYLLEKWGRACAYCGAKEIPLQVEHIVPVARSGSNRVSNLALACESCNQAKGTRTAAEFGHPEVQAQARRPLRDAAAMNITRWTLYRRLLALGLPLEAGSGGRTKYNRCKQQLPKMHWLDAACVGASTPLKLQITGVRPLLILATGHGHRRRCDTDRYGFPIRHRTAHKRFYGFQTGDMVRARVPDGRKTSGVHVGRVLVRASRKFDLVTKHGRVAAVHARYCTVLQHSSGYSHEYGLSI